MIKKLGDEVARSQQADPIKVFLRMTSRMIRDVLHGCAAYKTVNAETQEVKAILNKHYETSTQSIRRLLEKEASGEDGCTPFSASRRVGVGLR